jgi:hypothetical protein
LSKRTRTQQRFDELYDLAMKHHAGGWTRKKSDDEFERWAINNPDLVEGGAITTARCEYRKMVLPSLSGSLPQIRRLAKAIMDKEPPGTSRRFNHEFFKICRFARDHHASVSAGLQELASRL